MLSKEQIIKELYETQFVENFTKKFVRSVDIPHVADEIQEIYLIVCQMEEKRLQELYEADGINGVRRFLSGVIHRQMNSTTSKIHQLYRKRAATTYTTTGMTTEELEQGKKIIEEKMDGKK